MRRVFGFLLLSSLAWAGGTVAVTVTGVASEEGKLYVGFYTVPENFPQHKKRDFRKEAAPKAEQTVMFEDVKPGEYAIAVLHDRNGNDELDTNFLGMPKEPYGFSNNVRPAFSAPAFEACRFTPR